MNQGSSLTYVGTHAGKEAAKRDKSPNQRCLDTAGK